MTRGAGRILLAVAMLSLVVALPAAAAAPTPKLYFLKDGEVPLVGTGVLNATIPDGLDPALRPVVIGTSDLPSQVFTTMDEEHPGRLFGPVFVGLWTGPAVVLQGNLTTVIYAVSLSGDRTLLAATSVNVDLNMSNAPDPTSLIPPDPTDPEAAAAYVAAQVLAALLQPPALLYLGMVDIEVPADSQLALGFYLEAADGSPLPVPIGAAATIQYDAIIMPSFLYAPWYAPDPEPSQTQTRSTTPRVTGSPTTLGPGSEESEDSPIAGLLAALALVGVAAVLVRRRL
jgi:hypothetical protein